jgi:peptidoglycan/LPS O-acetylase OafA/YrhL
LPQIDVMRLLICMTVVATHVVSNANPTQSVPPNAVVNGLHYSRQAFFFISSLVLVYTSWSRVGAGGWLTRAPGQMRRRVAVLGTPYLLWSALYTLLGLATAYSLWAAKRLPWTYVTGLVQGTDGYHMYFLLVSVQFAVVFPLFLKLLHATRGHHLALLLTSCALEVATMTVFHYRYTPDFWWRPLSGESSLVAYQFWLIAGGVAALHLDRFDRWLVRHRAVVGLSLLGSVLVAAVLFFTDVAHGELPEFAGRSLQPVTVPLGITAIGACYLVSRCIVRLDAVWLRRPLAIGTHISFGIYLTHPAVLIGLLYLQRLLPVRMAPHPVLATALIGMLDLALSAAVAWLLSRTRWSKALIGRPPPALARPAAPVPAQPLTASRS